MTKKPRSGMTKAALKSAILNDIKRYESTAHRKVTAVSFPTKSRRVVAIDTVPVPE